MESGVNHRNYNLYKYGRSCMIFLEDTVGEKKVTNPES
jgi:hypothetical protein